MSKPDRGGWYDALTKEPRYFVPKKNGDGQRATTLADARKAETWVPGVTGILNVLAKPALVEWLCREACLAVLTTPRNVGEELDAFVKRVLETERVQDETAAAARDRGTEIHEAIERLAKGESIAEIDGQREALGIEDIGPWVIPAWEHLQSFGLRVHATEQVLIGYGYGGRCDLILTDGTRYHIVDIKSASKLPTKGSWFEHRLQLAAYAKAFGPPYPVTTTSNLYISTTEQGAYAYFDNGDWNEDYRCFAHLVAVWQHQNNYVPKQ